MSCTRDLLGLALCCVALVNAVACGSDETGNATPDASSGNGTDAGSDAVLRLLDNAMCNKAWECVGEYPDTFIPPFEELFGASLSECPSVCPG